MEADKVKMQKMYFKKLNLFTFIETLAGHFWVSIEKGFQLYLIKEKIFIPIKTS